MLDKIDKIQELLNVPTIDASTETAITNMKILNLLVDLRAESEQLFLSGVSHRREMLIAYEKKRSETVIMGHTEEEIVEEIMEAINCC